MQRVLEPLPNNQKTVCLSPFDRLRARKTSLSLYRKSNDIRTCGNRYL